MERYDPVDISDLTNQVSAAATVEDAVATLIQGTAAQVLAYSDPPTTATPWRARQTCQFVAQLNKQAKAIAASIASKIPPAPAPVAAPVPAVAAPAKPAA
jgi:uncharacterized lipoprotein YddW (UPF0748 family)